MLGWSTRSTRTGRAAARGGQPDARRGGARGAPGAARARGEPLAVLAACVRVRVWVCVQVLSACWRSVGTWSSTAAEVLPTRQAFARSPGAHM